MKIFTSDVQRSSTKPSSKARYSGYAYSSGDAYPPDQYSSATGCGWRPLLAKNRGPWNECMAKQQELKGAEIESQSKIVEAISTAEQTTGMGIGTIIGITSAVVVVTVVAIIVVKRMRKNKA